MRILHVARQFYPCVGGVERFTLDLCRYTRGQGHDVAVLTLDRDFASGARLPAHDEVEGIPVRRIPFFGPMRYRLAPSTLTNLGQCDLVHVHCVDFFIDYLSLTRSLHRRPLVLSTHGGFFHSAWGGGVKNLYFRTVTPLALHGVDRVVCDSPQDLALFQQVAPKKILLIENGVDFDGFSTVRKRVRPGLLVYVGRTDANKRVEMLIQTLAVVARRRPEARLALVGPDWLGEWPRLQEVTSALGLQDKVDFVGQVSEAELRRWLAEAHFFVSASVYEGFGIAAVEAMATGTVPILNDIPAFRHLTEDGRAGLLAQFDSPEVAAEVVTGALALPVASYEDLSSQARASAARFGWRQVVRQFLDLYAEVLGTTASGLT